MVWGRLEDDYASHPKLLAAGLDATGLDARAMSHCGKYGTDGFVGDSELVVLATPAKNPKAIADRLIAVRRWHRDEKGRGPDCESCLTWIERKEGEREPLRPGYWVHDFLAYNPSRKEVEAKREAERVRKASGRKAAGRGLDGRWDPARTTGGTPPGSGPDSASRPTAPDPTRPDPSLAVSTPTPTDSGVAPTNGVGEDFKEGSKPPTTDTDSTAGRLVRRMAETCIGHNRGLVIAEAALVVDHALRFVDWRVVDEAIGTYANAEVQPTLPRALVPAIQSRAQMSGVSVPAWVPKKRP